MAVDPYHRYSNEAERDNKEIYDDFKLKKPFGLHGLYKKISAWLGLGVFWVQSQSSLLVETSVSRIPVYY